MPLGFTRSIPVPWKPLKQIPSSKILSPRKHGDRAILSPSHYDPYPGLCPLFGNLPLGALLQAQITVHRQQPPAG